MKTLSDLFPGTHFTGAIAELETVYNEVEEKINQWKQVSALSCTPGCGLCCSKFEPDVLSIEADYAALYLCYEKADLLEKLDPSLETSHCIFYDAENPEHCMIYPARPLLCRLFAFSALSDKNNNPAFHLCTYIEPELTKRIYKGIEIEEYFRTPLPLMQDYSIRVNNITAGCANTPVPLRISVIQSVNKVKLLAYFTPGVEELTIPENDPQL